MFDYQRVNVSYSLSCPWLATVAQFTARFGAWRTAERNTIWREETQKQNTIIMLHEWMKTSAGFGARRNAEKNHYVPHEDKQKRAQFGHEEIKKTCAVCCGNAKKILFLAPKNVLYMIYCKRYSWAAFNFFLERVARVPVSLWGFWGWGCVRSTRVYLRNRPRPSATVRNHPQAFATVRNRPREGRMAVSLVSSAKGVIFGGFKRRVASFRVGRGTSWHDVFCNVWKIFWCGRRNTFATFSDLRCVAVFVAGATLWRSLSSSCVAGAALIDVSCCAFFANRIVRAATRCKFRGRRGVLWDVMKIDGGLARNIDFEVANLEVHKKTRRKTSILKLHSVEESRTKCSFWCSNMSRLESLAFLWPRRLYGGSCKTSPFRRLSCRFAWQAWRLVTFQPDW